VNLSNNQIVGAERVLSGPNLNVPGFVHSQEYAAADDMIQALRENDGELLRQILSKPAVTYLNIEIVKLARNIKVVELPKQSATAAAAAVTGADVHEPSQNVDALLM